MNFKESLNKTTVFENSFKDFGFEHTSYEKFCVAIFAQAISLSESYQKLILQILGYNCEYSITSLICEQPIPGMSRRPDMWMVLSSEEKKKTLVLIEAKTVSDETNRQMKDYRLFLNSCLDSGEYDSVNLSFLGTYKDQSLSDEPDIRMSWNEVVKLLPVDSDNHIESRFMKMVYRHLYDTCCVPESKGDDLAYANMLNKLCEGRPYIRFQNSPKHKQMRITVDESDSWVKKQKTSNIRQDHLFVVDKTTSNEGVVKFNSTSLVWPYEWVKSDETVEELRSKCRRYERNVDLLGEALEDFLCEVDKARVE